MTAVFFVMRFYVAPIVIWLFELPLDQEIRAVRVIRILLGFERGLVVVAIARLTPPKGLDGAPEMAENVGNRGPAGGRFMGRNMSHRLSLAALGFAAGAVLAASPASAADIRITCYSDGNECPVQKEMSAGFMKENPDINVIIDEVPYSAILQSLPVQLAAGHGPDIA